MKILLVSIFLSPLRVTQQYFMGIMGRGFLLPLFLESKTVSAVISRIKIANEVQACLFVPQHLSGKACVVGTPSREAFNKKALMEMTNGP